MTLLIRVLILALLCGRLTAHEMQPAYLEVKEAADQSLTVIWKLPFFRGKPLPIEPAFPDDWEKLTDPKPTPLGNSLLYRWKINPGATALDGARLSIDGPRARQTDVLLRASLEDGRTMTHVLRPEAPSTTISFDDQSSRFFWSYFMIGIEHILLGIDHLLFVLGLLLIVDRRWMLVKTITAFTIAHSITLALSTFAIIKVPSEPLNAAIALSILFLGPEIVRKWRGETSLTIRHPWLVASGFGLLHGIGFASGLSLTGVPREEIPTALLWFNVGVEAGQLAFVAVALATAAAIRTLSLDQPAWIPRLPGYAVGVFGAFWTIQRVTMMVSP
ncbi:MAG: HupE/UreJ family protein [Verrucomicrobiota bacterium]